MLPKVVREVGVHDFRMATKQQLFHLDGSLLGVAPSAVGIVILIATHGGRTCRKAIAQTSSGLLRMRSTSKLGATPTRWPPISSPRWKRPDTASLQQRRTPLSGLSHST